MQCWKFPTARSNRRFRSAPTSAPIFIAGMGKINVKFVVILNIQQVLSMDDMEALARIAVMSRLGQLIGSDPMMGLK